MMDPFDLRLWKGFEKSGGSLDKPAIIDQLVIDTRRISSPNSLFVALPGSFEDGHTFVEKAANSGAAYAIVKHDFLDLDFKSDLILLKVESPLRAFQEIAAAYRMTKKAKVIAIGGSYGKTMVKDLLFSMLKKVKCTICSPESFNSQIGVALSLLTIHECHEVAIIEAGISEKNEMDTLQAMIKPDSVIITHVGKKHQRTLGNLTEAASEILKLAAFAKSWVLLPSVLAKNGSYLWDRENDHLPFAKAQSTNLSVMYYELVFPDTSYYLGKTTTGFSYFLDLINIVVKAAWLEKVPQEIIIEVLNTFALEPMRCELWQSQIGTTFINDIYAEDPQSIDQSLKYLSQSSPNSRKTFMFGGLRGDQKHREIDYKRIGQAITGAKLEKLMLIGNHPFSHLESEVKKCSPDTAISFHPSMEEAIKNLQLDVQSNDLVLIKGEKRTSLDALSEAFDGSISNNQCTINLAAIQTNLATLRGKLPKETRIMVMVKALAYGTSEIRMAKFLKTANVDILGVSYVDEGVSLKKAGVIQEIFVLNAVIHEIPKILERDLSVGVSETTFIQELNRCALANHQKIKVHLHVNTGMNRFGCLPEDALNIAKFIRDCKGLQLDGILTHFAAADDPKEDDFTMAQANIFTKVIEEINAAGIETPWRHAANSSAVVRFHFPQFNMIRIGLAIFGLYASKDSECSLELRLALSLSSRVVGINECRAGDTVSYGRSYKVDKDKKIAVLPIGYFDGLHRNYSGKCYVLIHGKKAPMVGKICMDYMMVDVSDIPNVQIGDRVLIFGEDEYGHYLSPEEFATSGDSIVYELITCLGPRIQRVFVYEESLSLR